ncbi:hypothetical protein LEP1GSC029_1122 [Leptospira interrogans str. 2002000626]|uniref:Uncharacterized protein n=2 Tax=Leptospira interrogans TaxID=173 RepID=A0A829D3D6_LEPIR|nr:hypothetical protein LEP1GSC029_1122 [Leptospira interrogans str. 2002000626]EMY24972.1 hypothetical protein LEP1GSC115_2870 [Leptospira interrogans serovar Australis str. 200703203]
MAPNESKLIRNLRERIHKVFFLKTILPIFGRSPDVIKFLKNTLH